MNFKLGFGPMSHRIIRLLNDYALVYQRPIMIIASRNQIDKDSGYVMTTSDLSKHITKSPYIKLCRDHCGPYFLDNEKDLSLPEAIEATKLTIEADIENGFDLIHIDTSRSITPYKVADELFHFCLTQKKDIEFEFGTEENVGIKTSLKKYKESVDFAKNFPNVKFVVAQTGSLVMENYQLGKTSQGILKKLVDVANNSGVGLKEHNADYLSNEQIKLRKTCGVHALNIAPQLGVVETTTILDLAEQYNIDTTDFKNRVIENKKWKKWMLDDSNKTKVIVAGHYHFNSYEFKKLNDKLQKYVDIESSVKKSIFSVLDNYFENFYETSSTGI
jgi:hypothetical protein